MTARGRVARGHGCLPGVALGGEEEGAASRPGKGGPRGLNYGGVPGGSPPPAGPQRVGGGACQGSAVPPPLTGPLVRFSAVPLVWRRLMLGVGVPGAVLEGRGWGVARVMRHRHTGLGRAS